MNLIKHKKTRQIDVEWSAASQFPVIISLTINYHQILCISRLPDQICSVQLMDLVAFGKWCPNYTEKP